MSGDIYVLILQIPFYCTSFHSSTGQQWH